MEIKFKEKPSNELVTKCERKLSEFLKAHKLLVKIIIRDNPFIFSESTYINNLKSDENKTNCWIDKVILIAKDNKNISLNGWVVGLEGINEEISDRQLWSIAHDIQNAFYKKLDIIIYPPNRHLDDPYWKLWEDNKKLLGIN